jgi:hypothetical protein
MQNNLIILTAIAILTIGCGNKNTLFTGRDLTGWGAFPADATGIWSVKNGIIRCEGKPTGYLRSEREYGNYHLHIEWRWPQTAANSGVLLHTQGLDKVWPNSIEAQLFTGNAGDIILIGPNLSVTKFDITFRSEDQSSKRIPKQLNPSENDAGEWNSYDIFCKKNTLRLFVNGFLQNEVTNVSRTSGAICLQSEGGPIEFKNIYLEPLK